MMKQTFAPLLLALSLIGTAAPTAAQESLDSLQEVRLVDGSTLYGTLVSDGDPIRMRLLSGDEITIDWDTPCPCGLASVPIEHDIIRYSEKEGVEDDRITCAATQQVNDAAIDFMREFES